MRKKLSLLTALLVACVTFAVEESRVLFYPTVIKTAPNKLRGAEWKFDKGQKHADFMKLSGSPFSAKDPAWQVTSHSPESAYWRIYTTVKKNRVYLLGAWVRYTNAKILFWSYGKNAKNGNMVQARLYCFGGFNTYLENYLSDAIKQRLCGDPREWKLCFRTMSFPVDLKEDRFKINMGIYMATGEMVFTAPFFIDVTDNKDLSLCIDIKNAPKPIKKLTITHTALRDTIWTKEFKTPVRDFELSLPGVTDYTMNMDKSRIEGHSLNVFYEDGSHQIVHAPQEHIFQNR